MTHFTLGKQLTLCGQIVIATEYPDLFLLDLSSVQSLQPYRPADPKSIGLTSYFNAKIAFAHKESVAFAKNLYFLAQHDLCISQQATSSIRYAHTAAQQESLNQGTTIRLGDNIFATPSGEAYYRFVCRPINVTVSMWTLVLGLFLFNFLSKMTISIAKQPDYPHKSPESRT